MLKVFISSTSDDLQDHRSAVRNAILGAQHHPIDMKYFGSRTVGGAKASLDEVDRSDVLIGIYAWRYGTISEGRRQSITEQEFDHARKKGIPRFCFLVDEDYPWHAHRDTGEAAERLKSFKKKVRRKQTVCRFTTPDQLALQVVNTLATWINTQAERPPAWTADPKHRKLQEVFDLCTNRVNEEYDTKTGCDPFLVDLKWRHLRDPKALSKATEAGQPLAAAEVRKLFDKYNRLLMRGELGSGKTVLLLQLADELCDEAARAPEPPRIPVVFQLGNWHASEGEDLSTWLRIQLLDDYSSDPKDARGWIEDGQLLPLLDGFEVIPEEEKAVCIEAINRFLSSHGGGFVVTACTAESFKLQAEIVLEPLSDELLETSLAEAQFGVEALEAALREHEWVRELAHTPLFLAFLLEGFRTEPQPTLERLLASAPEDRKNELMEASVERLLTRVEPVRRGRKRARRSLAWLARRMVEHRVMRFEIEALQPTWLSSSLERGMYAVVTRGLVGALTCALLGWSFGYRQAFPLVAGAVAGVLIGLIDALPFWPATQGRDLRNHVRVSILRATIAGAVTLFSYLFIAGRWIDHPLPQAFTAALLLAAVFAPRPVGLKADTRLFDDVRMGWSWKGAFYGFSAAVGAVLLLVGLSWALPRQTGQLRDLPTSFWVIISLLLALLTTPLGGVLGGLRGEVLELRRQRNLGLRNVWRNGLRVTRGTAAVLAPAAALASAILWLLNGGTDSLSIATLTGLGVGAAISVYVGFWFSGMDALQHLLLRLQLSLTRRFPWRWTRFLDDAATAGLLNASEGGYEFPHALLRNHWAEQYRRPLR